MKNMIDFGKMQQEYLNRFWKAEMRIGSPDTQVCNLTETAGGALLMIECYAIARIIDKRWLFIRDMKNGRGPDLLKIWNSFQDAERISLTPAYDIRKDGKPVRVFTDGNGNKHAFNAAFLDKYGINETACNLEYLPKHKALCASMYADPLVYVLEIRMDNL